MPKKKSENKHKREEIRKIQKENYLKCALNPDFFMRRYCRIQDQEEGLIPFDLYPFQEKTLEEFQEYRFNVILKARQMGLSTLTSAYALWMMLFNENRNVKTVALKQDVAKGLVKKVRIMHDNLPTFLQQKKIIDNQLSIQFDNGSTITAETTTSNAGRSDSLALLIIDEAAFIDDAGPLWNSILPTLSQSNGDAIVLSTPSNIGTWFHEMWTKAVSGAHMTDDTTNQEDWTGTGENDFHPIKLHWSLHPERDSEWRKEQDNRFPPKKAAREYDCSFEESGNSVIGMSLIEDIEDDEVEAPAYKVPVFGQKDLWIWKEPDPSKNYIVSSDVGRGDDDSDFSTIEVFESRSIEQVAEYRGRIRPYQLADQIINVATMYQDGIVVVERENYGWGVLARMIERGYENILHTSNDLHIANLKGYSDNSNKKVLPGIATSRKTRPIIISKFEEYINKGFATIRSSRLTEEMKTFVWKSNHKAEHMEGYYDDLIFATMFAFWSRDTAIRLSTQNEETSKAAIESIKNQRTEKGIYTPQQGGNPYVDPDTGEDYSWVLD